MTIEPETDRKDARAIEQVVRTGWFRAVHVKSVLSQELRGLLAARKLLVGKVRDLDNAVRALLRSFGLKMGQIGERAFAERTYELLEGRVPLQTVLAPLLEARPALLVQRNPLYRQVLMAVRSDPICRRLITVPEVEPVTAVLLGRRRSEPIDPLKRCFRTLWSDTGALPVRRDGSNRTHQQTGRRLGAPSSL